MHRPPGITTKYLAKLSGNTAPRNPAGTGKARVRNARSGRPGSGPPAEDRDFNTATRLPGYTVEFDQFEVRTIELELREPFSTSFGTVRSRQLLVVGAKRDGRWIYGEASPLRHFTYNHEAPFTARRVATTYVVPALRTATSPEEYHREVGSIRGHHLATSTGDQILYYARSYDRDLPVAHLLGGTRSSAHCGISIGIKEDDELVDTVQRYLDAGYRRIKLKIEPGRDYEYVRTARDHFPDIDLMADANSAYSLAEVDRLRRLDELELTMIEQPLAHDDLVDHARLADAIETPICLDESILSAADARKAAELGACEVINLKPQRVGGFHETRRIDEVCASNGIDLWIGGLLESGIGQSMAIIASSLGQVSHPGDIGGSTERYFHEDVVDPEIRPENGSVPVPAEPGMGRTVDRTRLERATIELETMEGS